MSHGKHCLARKSLAARYAEAHKPVHVTVTVCLFIIELVMVFTVHEIIAHAGLATAMTAWELRVIAAMTE